MSTAIELVNMEQKAEQEMTAALSRVAAFATRAEIVQQEADKQMAPIMEKLSGFLVQNEEDYHSSDILIKDVRAKSKEKEDLLPLKKAVTKAWKVMCALVATYIDNPLEECKTLDRKRYAWKKAEDDRRAREAEAARKQAEKKAAEEKLALAQRMEAEGMKEQADAVLDAPVAPVSVPEPVKVEKPEGQTHVENWQARVVDEKLIPREYLTPDLVALGKLAKLMKGKASVPGVVFEDVGSVRRRG